MVFGYLMAHGLHGARPITAREVQAVLRDEQEVVGPALAHGLWVQLPLRPRC